MKSIKIFNLALLLFSCSLCTAQQNDWNLGFEEWNSAVQFGANTHDPSDAGCYLNIADDLEYVINSGSIASNQIVDGWSAASFGLLRSSDAHSGNYAAVVCMWYNGSTGILRLGNDASSFDCKVHFEEKIYGISGYYKYILDSLGPHDTYNKYVTAHIRTYKFNVSSGVLETLSNDSLIFMKTQTYKPFQLIIQYPEPGIVPDSVGIWFESNGYGSGTTTCGFSHFLYLDDLDFHFFPMTTSLEHPDSLSTKLKIFPNPAKDNIQLKYSGLHIQSLQLADLFGRTIKTFPPKSKTLDVTNVAAGAYFLKIEAMEGKIMKKVVIVSR